ncbi:hypothetical protein D0Z00_002828 [Geotrichum galactomycetum]|uniref:Uncharacterized protein n=1 Tax=Geotrichum galactomycetum TaxID=27317 RepID=A0ACB6V325_9ASCO|nr:hypothetical protein D0Z00_002828 [Geotrichum candidum]
MPTITYGPRAPQSYAAIEYDYSGQQNHGIHSENSLTVRPKAAGLSVYHGPRPKVPQDFEVNPKVRIPHAPTMPAQSKFIQQNKAPVHYSDDDDEDDDEDDYDDENDLSDPAFDKFLIKPSSTIPEEPENILDETDDNFSQPTPEEPNSISDLKVKQARSDRKIQDLEISNASLMAVNKYLEKRLRTQSKDLQYLKTNTSIELTRFDSDSDDEKEGDEADEDEATNENDENLSPEEKELATKTKMIEKRMQAHIEFLESSEKINTMMRNCLLLTDTLIQEASKSMEYEVDSFDHKYGLHLANHDFINNSDEIILPDEPIQEQVAA